MFDNKEKYEKTSKKLFKIQIIFINAVLIIAIIGTLFLDSISVKEKALIILLIIILIIIILFVKKGIYKLIFVKLKDKLYRKK